MDRIAIVTGGGRGIGAAISRQLMSDGKKVIVWDLAQTLAEDGAWMADFPDVHAMTVDVSSDEAVNNAVTQIVDEIGPIGILVNNAAVSPTSQGKRVSPVETSTAEWDTVMAVNLRGPFLAMRAVLPSMLGTGWGRVINISSKAGRSGAWVAGLPYGVAKTGINGLTRTMAAEVGKYGVTVNSVAPGRIATPMVAGLLPEISAKAMSEIPVGREGRPEDVAGLVSYLASEASGFVTGAVFDINGGSYMAP